MISPVSQSILWNYQADNLRIADAIGEELHSLDSTLSQTRRRDLEHNERLIRETQKVAIQKALARPQPRQLFSKISPGHVALPALFTDDPPAKLSEALAYYMAAVRLATSKA